MNNPFDLLKLYKVAQLQEHLLSNGTNNNFDFSILDLLEINNRQNNLSKQFLSELFILNFIKITLSTDNIEAICTYLVSFLKEDLYSNLPRKTLPLLHSIESLLKDSDKEIILVHMMSAYFYITQGNKKSSRDIISDYLNIIQKNNDQDSRTPKEALDQLKRNISACSIFPYLNEAAGYTSEGKKINAKWIEENLFNGITDNLMLDIFLTHNKKSLPFQLKYLNAQDGDSKTGHVYRMPYYQYQLEKLNLLLDGCKMSLIVTNRDTDEQKINKLISQYTFELMTNSNYLYLTSIILPTLKYKGSKKYNEITDFLLDRFYGCISLLSLLPYPRLQRKLLIHFSNKYFNFFNPIIDYYEVYYDKKDSFFERISKMPNEFRNIVCDIIKEIDTKNAIENVNMLDDISIFKAIDEVNNIILLLLRYSLSLEEYLQTYIEVEKNKSEKFCKAIQDYLLYEIEQSNDIFLYESNHEHILPSVFFEYMKANDDRYHFDKEHFFDTIPEPNDANNSKSSDNRPYYHNQFALKMSNNFALTFPAVATKFRAADAIFKGGETFIERYNLREKNNFQK